MGRGRGKGRKHHDDSVSVEDEKLPMRRRGRPQKPLTGDIDEEDKKVMIEKEDDVVEETEKSVFTSKKSQTGTEYEKKRKREGNEQLIKEENKGAGAKTIDADLIKFVGFRANGSRRKNKPRRAAEVGVECQ